ncbi:hypothetical protein ACTI_73740 [Actinoplanes sp. OR16]|nr:hypothetical protein ACTI_73740 [Actinoplanes sp. OR16]
MAAAPAGRATATAAETAGTAPTVIGSRMTVRRRQAAVQAGVAAGPVPVPWKPNSVDPPAAIWPL